MQTCTCMRSWTCTYACLGMHTYLHGHACVMLMHMHMHMHMHMEASCHLIHPRRSLRSLARPLLRRCPCLPQARRRRHQLHQCHRRRSTSTHCLTPPCWPNLLRISETPVRRTRLSTPETPSWIPVVDRPLGVKGLVWWTIPSSPPPVVWLHHYRSALARLWLHHRPHLDRTSRRQHRRSAFVCLLPHHQRHCLRCVC